MNSRKNKKTKINNIILKSFIVIAVVIMLLTITPSEAIHAQTQKTAKGGDPPLNELVSGVGSKADENYGWNVSYAGDVNGDGYNDTIVGAPHNDTGGADAGAAYIFFGKASWSAGDLDATNASVAIYGKIAGGHFGWSVSDAGDVNGTYDDVIIGCPDSTNGNAYIIYGWDIKQQAAGDKTIYVNDTDVTITNISGGNSGDKFGFSVSGAGNVDNSGNDDVIVGAPYNYTADGGTSNAGAAYIFYGDGSIPTSASSADVKIYGDSTNYNFGYSVSCAGDTNSANYDDVIIGVPGADRAYIYHGDPKTENASSDISENGTVVPTTDGYKYTWVSNDSYENLTEVLAGSGITYLIQEDFEADNGDFTQSGARWEWGDPTGAPLVDAHSGTNCWGTDLDADYQNGDDAYLQSPTKTIPSDAVSAWLEYWFAYEIELGYDGFNLKISVDGGSWTVVPTIPYDYTLLAGSVLAGETAWSGTTAWRQTWQKMCVNLTQYAGSSVQFRWHFGSDTSSGVYAGILIDDVKLWYGYRKMVVPNAIKEPDDTAEGAGELDALQYYNTSANDRDIQPSGGVGDDGWYTADANQVMSIDGFDVGVIPEGAAITGCMLEMVYTVEAGFTGGTYIQYDNGGGLTDTTIIPTSGEQCKFDSYDLYAQDVNTRSEIEVLDIRYLANDAAAAQAVSFDFVWLNVSYSVPIASNLEHKWPFSIPKSGSLTFYVEANHTPNNEHDNFTFYWNTTDSGWVADWNEMLTVTKTSDDNTAQNYSSSALNDWASSGGGTLYIGVIDTDRGDGNNSLDTLYVDNIYVNITYYYDTLYGDLNSNFGFSVSNISTDVTGSGGDDVAVGAPDTANGSAYVYYGGDLTGSESITNDTQAEFDTGTHSNTYATSGGEVNLTSTTYLFDDFEDEDLAGWTVYEGVSCSVTNSGDYGHSGSRSVKVVDESATGFANIEQQLTTHIVQGAAEAWIKTTTDSDPFRFLVLNSDNTGEESILNVAFSGGNIQAADGNGAGGGSWVTVQSYDANTWYHIRVALDTVTNTYDVFIDDMTTAAGTNYGFIYDQDGSYQYFDTIHFETYSTGTSTTYFDDAYMYNYSASGTYLSASTTTQGYIHSVTPTWNKTLNGQTLTVYISRDNGTTWNASALTNNTKYTFTTESNGYILRYKVEFSTSHAVYTPILHNITIIYTYIKVAVNLTGAKLDDKFGYSVSGGNINSDSYGDIIVGAPFNASGGSNAGAVYIFNGSSSMSSSISALNANYTNYGTAAGDNFGFSVSYCGNINGDSYNDTIVGAPFNDTATNAGKVYVLSTAAAGANNAPTLTNGAVNPTTGTTATTFTYNVTYADADDDSPTGIVVYILKGGSNITSSPFTMTWQSGSNTTGANYTYSTTLSATGTDYTYYFNATDGTDNATPTSSTNAPDVTEAVVVTVNAPNGGEVWAGGSTKWINFTISGGSGDYTYWINYSTDGGSSWIAHNTSTVVSAGTYNWSLTVWSVTSTQCRVNVTIKDSSSQISYDTSNADFEIDSTAPDITTLAAGSPTTTSITLTWTAPGDDGASGTATSYEVRYSTAGEINAGNWASATEFSQSWTPLAGGIGESHVVDGLNPGTPYWFAIKTTDNVGLVSGVSNSPTATTISGMGVTVNSPSAAGIAWQGGLNKWINYTISGGSGQRTVKLYYSTAGAGGPWTFIAYHNQSATGTYNYTAWDTSGITSTSCYVNVSVNDSTTSGYDLSNDPFTIDSTAPTSSATAISPYWWNATITVSASASDNYELKNITLYYAYSSDNLTGWPATLTDYTKGETKEISGTPWSGSFSFPPPTGEGYYRFYTRAEDQVGNFQSVPTNFQAIAGYDITKPTSTIATPVESSCFNCKPIWLNGTCSDALSGIKSVEINITYKDNNSLVQAWTNANLSSNYTWWDYPFSPTEEANYTIRIRAVDNASNHQGSISVNITYDTTPPTTTITLVGTLGTNGWYISDVIVNLTATDTLSGVLRIENRTGGMSFGTYIGNFTLTADGTYYIQYRAVDNAGNVEEKNLTTIKIDKTKPESPQLLIPDNDTWVNTSSVLFDWQDSSDLHSGIANYTLQVSKNESFSYFNYTANNITISENTSSLLNDGIYYWRVIVKDNAGNSNTSDVWRVKIDTEKPGSPVLIAPVNVETSYNTPKFEWFPVTDAFSETAYYTIQVSSKSSFLPGDIVYEANPVANYSTPTTTIDDGTYWWRARAVDNANNVGEWSTAAFSINSGAVTGLKLQINSGANYTNSTSVVLTISVDNPIAGYCMCFSNDGVLWSGYESYSTTKTWDLANNLYGGNDTEGKKTVYVRCKKSDVATAFAQSDSSIILDLNPPHITLQSPGNDIWTNSSWIEFKWKAWDNFALSGRYHIQIAYENYTLLHEMYLDNSTINNDTSTYEYSLSDGRYLWRVRAEDKSFNWSGFTDYWVVKIDTQKPAGPSLYQPADNIMLTEMNVTFRWQNLSSNDSSGIYQYELWIDTNIFYIPGQNNSTTMSLSDGAYNWKVRAVDIAGNVGEFSETLSFTVDREGPKNVRFLINGDAIYTNTEHVYLGIYAENTAWMRFSNDSENWTEWEPYTVMREWCLLWIENGTVERTVYLECKSWNDVKSPVISDSITLDKRPPFAYILNESQTININYFVLGWYCEYSVLRYDISTNGADWTNVSDNTTWNFTSLKGCYNVLYVRAVAFDGTPGGADSLQILVDTKKPVGVSLGINSNMQFTNSTTVELRLKVQEDLSEDFASGLWKICLWDDEGGNETIEINISKIFDPVNITMEWVLLGVDGSKTVWLKVVDKAGNEAITWSTIFLDRVEPANPSIIMSDYTNSTLIALTLSADDPGTCSGLWQMCFSEDEVNWGEWVGYSQSYNYILQNTEDDIKTIYFKVRDRAGNENTASEQIVLDGSKPEISVIQTPANLTEDYFYFNITVTISEANPSGTPLLTYRIGSESEVSENMIMINVNVFYFNISKHWDDYKGMYIDYTISYSDMADNTNSTVMCELIDNIVDEDLFVSYLFWEPDKVTVGEVVNITAVVHNNNESDLSDVKVVFYWRYWDIYCIPIGEILVNLPAGSSMNISINYTFGMDVEGYLDVKIDPDNNIPEIDKTNNILTKPFTVWELPELMLVDVSFTPEMPVENETIYINADIENRGGDFSKTFTVEFWIGRFVNNTFNGSFIGAITSEPVSSSSSSIVSYPWKAVPGEWVVYVEINSTGIRESRMDNNNFSANLTVLTVGINVFVDWLDTPQSVEPGAVLDYDIKIKNMGNVNETFNLSVDAPSGWKTTLLYEGKKIVNVTLEKGEEKQLTLRIHVPDDAKEGDVNIKVIATSQSMGTVSYTETVVVKVKPEAVFQWWIIAVIAAIVIAFLVVLVKTGVLVVKGKPEKVKVEPGYNYLIKGGDVRKAYHVFMQLMKKTPGLCITSTHPRKRRDEYKLTCPVYWLTDVTKTDEKTLHPERLDFELFKTVNDFVTEKHGVILLDGLEYLIHVNGFERAMDFIDSIRDAISTHKGTLVVPANPSVFKEEELGMLEKRFDRILG